MTPTPYEPPAHPEDQYQAELLSTEISRRTARVMSWLFVLLLVAVPLSQAAIELRHGHAPQVLDVFRPARTAIRALLRGDTTGARAAASTLVSRDFPRHFEQSLGRASRLKNALQPRMQAQLTARAGLGNDKAVIGRDGWLFFQPGIDYVAGPDITSPAYLALAAKKRIDTQGEHDPSPDPRPGLLAFARDCAALGIHLIVLPIPDKAMLQPGRLTTRMAVDRPITPPNNHGFDRFVAELRAAGIDVLDPTPATISSSDLRYLAQDTHWTPEFMDRVAADVARRITAQTPATSADANPFSLRRSTARRVGDIVDLLKLPANQTIYAPQSVTIQQIVDTRTGRLWERNPAADVLLLGDSFTNIYSQPSMGWGESAGFAEHVSYHLGRAIDVIAMNGAGASGAREELARRAASATTPWPSKVIVYEFAMRFLMGENWQTVPFTPPHIDTPVARPQAPTPALAQAPAPPIIPDGPTVARVRVLQVSTVPAPGTAPYKDCLTYLRLQIERVESGHVTGTEVIGAFRAMTDDVWLPAATYAVGDRLTVTMVPMDRADRAIQSMQRADHLNDFTHAVFFITKESKP